MNNELNVRATSNHVIVKLLKPRQVEMGGGKIILPDSADAKYKPQFYGVVLSFGEEVTTLVLGDVVFFHAAGGQDMMLGNNICRVLKYEEIYGIEIQEEARVFTEDDFMVFRPQDQRKIITPPTVKKGRV